jgi:hypothetical protein
LQLRVIYGVPQWGVREDPATNPVERNRLLYMIGDFVIVSLFVVCGFFAVKKTNTIAYVGCLLLTILNMPLPILATDHWATFTPIVVSLGVVQSVIILMLVREIQSSRTDFLQDYNFEKNVRQ